MSNGKGGASGEAWLRVSVLNSDISVSVSNQTVSFGREYTAWLSISRYLRPFDSGQNGRSQLIPQSRSFKQESLGAEPSQKGIKMCALLVVETSEKYSRVEAGDPSVSSVL